MNGEQMAAERADVADAESMFDPSCRSTVKFADIVYGVPPY